MKRILSYADRHSDASFQCNPGFIYIRNAGRKVYSVIGWTIAAFLLLIPFFRHFLPGTTSFAFDDAGLAGWFGLFIYAFCIFGCISAGFWWSTIRADVTTGQLQYHSRWGPFTRRLSLPLRTFTEVQLERDSDGCTVVALIGLERLEIVRWRTRKESVRIARLIARRLCLPLTGEEEDDFESKIVD